MLIYGFQEIFDKVEDYNKRIEQLMHERQRYMDSVMNDISPFKVGEEYVNIKNGKRTKVRSIYRGSSVGKDFRYCDNSISDIHAEFDNGDNTSRYSYEFKCPYIKAEDYDNKSEIYYKKLEDLVFYS